MAALVGLEKRVEIHGNIQRFQPLDFLVVFLDFGCYLKLDIVPVGAVIRYFLSLCIPIFMGYGDT